MSAQPLHISVRMYKVGELGDCFLLQFKDGSQSSNVLIDSGSFRNSKTSKERMVAIWKDIRKQLKDKPLDVVVGTHQHNDHLSGFVHAKAEFNAVNTEQVWLSWLDDPKNNLAKTIKKEQEKMLAKLTALGKKFSGSSFGKIAVAEKVRDVLEFSINLDNSPAIPAEGISILKKAGKKTTRYLEPGEIVPLPNMEETVKVYVLGPPTDKKKLRDIHSSQSESYDPKLAAASMQAEKLISAFDNYTGNEVPWEETHFPFTDHYKIPVNKFPSHSDNCKKVWNAYNDRTAKWKKIDDDWLEEAGNLALYMDKYTNNTSLVLAFQLVRSGRVLLFVGDAQTGNWNSWKDIQWENTPPGFNINALLNNTILYKVGHHCSHNATSVEGLEAMTHEDLIAMIPVDKSDPNITKKNGWRMPAKNLYKRLKEKTNNRVLRMDMGFADGCASDRTDGKKGWNSLSYDHEVKESDLFIQHEFTI